MTRSSSLKSVAIAVVIIAISIAHYTTNPGLIWWHVLYQDPCYAPILIAAYWFGAPGGIGAALLAGLGTIAHFHETWHDNPPFVISEYGQAIGFVIAGAVGGTLATAQRRATRRHEQARAEVEAANAELRASHEQLMRADRLSSLGEIAAGLAHEIGNPLGGVKGALEIMTSRAIEGSPEAEFSALASREIGRLERLIDEFLRYARPHEPRCAPTDLFDVLERVVSLLHREAEDHPVTVHVARAPLPRVSIDAEQIAQVFVNIVLNAIQVSPRGGHVSISASVRDDSLAVDVQDEGPGIRPEHLPKILNPFFSTKKRGTGLGLGDLKPYLTTGKNRMVSSINSSNSGLSCASCSSQSSHEGMRSSAHCDNTDTRRSDETRHGRMRRRPEGH